jgi:MtN3 and saliva related transmembrane protein
MIEHSQREERRITVSKKVTEAIGTIAGCLTTIAFVPQIFTTWSHVPKPATDISPWTFFILSLGTFLWAIYGGILRSRPIVIANVITFVFSASVLAYKLIYG